jgi:hypothetical protein
VFNCYLPGGGGGGFGDGGGCRNGGPHAKERVPPRCLLRMKMDRSSSLLLSSNLKITGLEASK